jgi:hypothetical protein
VTGAATPFSSSPWSETLIEVTPPRSGNLGFVCRLFDHEKKMTGAIVVR